MTPGHPPGPHVGTADRRRVALLLETADVLAERAARTADTAQAQVLLRRSAQRRAQAERLASDGSPRGRPGAAGTGASN
ncbi:hypothetical protein E9549_13580 [Blastococcus sp. MG754426]|uniref:hypothetical protein n=1 Tax=unclassified Blastococcus TaxID=2619396 RepID=UPI001EEFB78B|nr:MULTISPECIES: hypothetical protein [unclassified Blastococcus]MCF6508430.1 hypothetical protein [Blastococcus sp. MG754426]MCF6513431.1 hypothetical protein [Blastococcus sp. MG754427]